MNKESSEQKKTLLRRGEDLFCASRWLLLPFYLGIIVALLILMAKFMSILLSLIPGSMGMGTKDLLLEVLTLVDVALVANLMVMVAFVGYHQFIRPLNDAAEFKFIPPWLTATDYHGLKLKAIGSVAIICAIEVLRIFLNVREFTEYEVKWRVFILLAVGATGLMLAIMDKLAHDQDTHH